MKIEEMTEKEQRELLSKLIDKHPNETLKLLKEKGNPEGENDKKKANDKAFDSYLTDKFGENEKRKK